MECRFQDLGIEEILLIIRNYEQRRIVVSISHNNTSIRYLVNLDLLDTLPRSRGRYGWSSHPCAGYSELNS